MHSARGSMLFMTRPVYVSSRYSIETTEWIWLVFDTGKNRQYLSIYQPVIRILFRWVKAIQLVSFVSEITQKLLMDSIPIKFGEQIHQIK